MSACRDEIHRVAMVLDFVCLESYIGFTRLGRAIDRVRRDGGNVVLTIEPFQLRPDASFAGEPLFEQHKRDRGETVAREIADGIYGVQDGLTVNLQTAWFTNTFRAHRLQARASAQGRGERMAERLFRAYYTEGLDLAESATLARLANEVGVTEEGAIAGAELRHRLDAVRRRVADRPPEFRFGHGHGDRYDGTVLAGLRGGDELYAALTGR